MLRKILVPMFYQPLPNHSIIPSISLNPITHLRLSLSTFPPNSVNLQTLCSNGRLGEALSETAVQDPDFRSCATILNECIDQKSARDGRRVHARMVKTRSLSTMYLNTRLIVLYARCDCLADARKVLDEMPLRNVVSWTAMISAYSKKGFSGEALSLFAQMMRSEEAEPNEFTLATVVALCAGPPGADLGAQIHSQASKRGLEAHIFVGSSLLDMYCKAGMVREARRVFESLPERDVVSCTAIISGYAQLGLDEEALSLFRRLFEEGMVPNHVTYSCLLTSLSGLAALDLGRQVHGHFLRTKTPQSVVLGNSLIDMYSKCGSLVHARRVFDGMSDRTVVSWNAMLVGYGKHGSGPEAAELFDLMKREGGTAPVSVTLLAVLSGLSHGGMEEKGLELFREMEAGKYGPGLPERAHYSCAVDLLGRSGRVAEALGLVERMPFEPVASIWGSLLGACRVHSNVDIGELAGRRLMEIEPENAGNYVVLSNLYSSVGRWDDARAVRELMKERVVTKPPGRSWIEIDRTVHAFHAGERSHPRRDEAREKVKELSAEFKGFGYVPDLSCVLFDVDEEQKERILLDHSEKLALAFGLVATPEGRPVRVIKNLRICVDCHNFAKVFSKVCRREVSLRDKTRFHSMVDGICSCGDYW